MNLIKFLSIIILFFTCSNDAIAKNQFGTAPDISLRTTKGALVELKDYRGQVVLINFWASWCAPCIHELPKLQKIYKDLKGEKFIVLGINVDEARNKSGVKPLAKKLGLKFPILLDPEGTTLSLYNPDMGIPFTVIIDQQGNIYAYFSGYSFGMENEIKKAVEEAIDKDKE